MKKIIVFDMDGTLADLYSVENWLGYLQRKDATPYRIAKPIYDADTLNILFDALRGFGYQIVVTSWLARESDRDFDNRIRSAKYNWIRKQGLHFDDIHIVKYGTQKANVTREDETYQILVDDEERNLNSWDLGATIDAKTNVINALIKLIKEEMDKMT